jgi:two-component system response regulator PilR (NtrC family)
MQMKKVLIVEDDLNFATYVKLALRGSNYEIDIADDGRSALDLLSKKDYDLVISDYRLPHVHGVDVLKAAKRHNPQCETVLISAAEYEKIESVEDLNLLGFLQKPFLPAKLRELISQGINMVVAGVAGILNQT